MANAQKNCLCGIIRRVGGKQDLGDHEMEASGIQWDREFLEDDDVYK